MTTSEPGYPNPTQIPIQINESPSYSFLSRHRCCCFPSSSSSSSSLWARVWAQPIKAFKKIREWSEIVAGPKWKTFIRRFNRRHRNHQHHSASVPAGQFQYDPLSYAMNFDDGQQLDEDYGQQHFPDFSSRFAASTKDFGKCGSGTPVV